MGLLVLRLRFLGGWGIGGKGVEREGERERGRERWDR